ncbi:RagB/SusD family nutrient uptake outer membrane protein [Zunongwangia sp. HGR-M22]|uniref:RagB/SusD family nutrient uptake outer membrane protein n=1 Tax=Zunongwangia sp. HGR-M22 TaxID=3015168 RepID=UPI0022DE0F44|nr:RagB/SusD family nutrient uptake outer membrane protein [Zunongwangia sp. HGR-M22]WBL24723.1 RagB/SusD family nutrient uptake outer membrane protein [Zunongwangia sp. HGR-M22]
MAILNIDTMKWNYKILKGIALAGVIAGLFSSCDDYLDVSSPSNLTEAEVFEDLSYTSSALTAVYSDLVGDNGYGIRMSLYYPMSADDMETSGDYNCNDRRAFSMYQVCSSNAELNRPFLQLYSGIERANLIIFNVPKSNIFNNGTESEQQEMRQYLGEAMTLRAQYYYELIRNWGDVPFQDKPASQYENIYLPKTDRDSIYEVLLTDLEVAKEYVPWRSESSATTTRVTKAFVKGLRARIALARAGYSLRRDPVDMIQGTNPEKYYQIAREECYEIMQNRNQHNLNPDYEDIFRALHENREDATNEMIFKVGAYGANSKTDTKLGFYNGLRIDAASSYGRGGGGVNALPTYFYEFDRNDERRDVTINIFQIDAEDKTKLTSTNSFTDGKFKKTWTNITGSTQQLGIEWPIMRFADILLMYAEAENELNNGPTSGAIEALTEVRARAFSDNPEEMPEVNANNYQEFFAEIMHERLLEFGGEGIRRYDLIRWNELESTIAETRQKLTDFMNGTGEYKNVPDAIYYQPSDYDPSTSASQTVSNLDIFFNGTSQANVFYQPTAESVPAGYSKVNWRAQIDDDYINGERSGFAYYFQPNHSELVPFYDEIINTNYNLSQDYGY